MPELTAIFCRTFVTDARHRTKSQNLIRHRFTTDGNAEPADDFCYEVRDLNKEIRFAGLASSKGKLVGYAYRRGNLWPLKKKAKRPYSIRSQR